MSTSNRFGPRFDAVIAQLEHLRADAIASLRQGDRTHLAHKLQLDDAIASLRFCEAHAITAAAVVTQLPETRTRTPSSEYRIVEDHESDDRELWTELHVDQHPVRPSPGMLLLDCGLWPDPVNEDTP